MEKVSLPGPALRSATTQQARYEDAAVCDRHEMPIERASVRLLGNTFSFGSGCSACDEEASHEEQRRDQQRQTSQFLKLQDASGIPNRYRSAKLGPFPEPAPGQEAVLEDAKRFIETVGKGSTGLILLGKIGPGKTHVACAILNEFLRRELSGRYLTTVQAVRLIKETYRSESQTTEGQALKSFYVPHLLVLDEVGMQHGTDTECLVLNEIINERYGRMLPTILVSNLTMKEFIELLGERVVDRFREGGKVLIFPWGSQRVKVHSQEKSCE